MALNLPAMQVLARPVSSYLEGKSIRLAQQREQQNLDIGDQEWQLNELKLAEARNPTPEAPDPQDLLDVQEFMENEGGKILSGYEGLRDSVGETEAQEWANTRAQGARDLVRKNYPCMPIEDGEWNYEAAKGVGGEEGLEGTTINMLPPGEQDITQVQTFYQDDPENEGRFRSGWTRVGVAQPQGTPDELGLDPRTRSDISGEAQDVRDRNRAAQQNIGEIGLTLMGIQGIESPTGFKAALGEKLGGIVGQFDESSGSAITQLFTGADLNDLATVRTRAKAVTARLLPSITGEESGRFTDTERRLATQVSGAIDLAQSKDQVISNLSELVGIEFRGMWRDSRFAGNDFPVDLTADEGVNDFYELLTKTGVPREKAGEIIVILQDIQTGDRY